MAVIRIVPKGVEKKFPYEKARQLLLLEDTDTVFERVDFQKMIEVGRRIGWTEEMIHENEQLESRGKCFRFRIEREPFLQGTLYENNIFFSFAGRDHYENCLPEIQKLAKRLNCELFYQ